MGDVLYKIVMYMIGLGDSPKQVFHSNIHSLSLLQVKKILDPCSFWIWKKCIFKIGESFDILGISHSLVIWRIAPEKCSQKIEKEQLKEILPRKMKERSVLLLKVARERQKILPNFFFTNCYN